MQSERIYSAPSLIDVVKQLLIYRPTGVLTIWRAAVSRQDEVRITVEQGRPMRVFWGASYIEDINEFILKRFNSWGEIHFSFQTTDTRLQLPSPTQHPLQSATVITLPFPTTPGHRISHAQCYRHSSTTYNNIPITSANFFTQLWPILIHAPSTPPELRNRGGNLNCTRTRFSRGQPSTS